MHNRHASESSSRYSQGSFRDTCSSPRSSAETHMSCSISKPSMRPPITSSPRLRERILPPALPVPSTLPPRPPRSNLRTSDAAHSKPPPASPPKCHSTETIVARSLLALAAESKPVTVQPQQQRQQAATSPPPGLTRRPSTSSTMSSYSILSQARSLLSSKGASPKAERLGAPSRSLSGQVGRCASSTSLEAGEETEIMDDDKQETEEQEAEKLAPRKSTSWVRAVSNWRANTHTRSVSTSGSLYSVSNVSFEGGVDESPKPLAPPVRGGKPRRGSFTERVGEMAQNAKLNLGNLPKPAFLRRSASLGSLKSFTAALALRRPKTSEEEEEEAMREPVSLSGRRSMEPQQEIASTTRYPNNHRSSTALFTTAALEPLCKLLPPSTPVTPRSPASSMERKRKSSMHTATLEPRRALRHGVLPPLAAPTFKLELPSVPKKPHSASVDAEVLRRASALPARLIQPRAAAAPAVTVMTSAPSPLPLAPPPTLLLPVDLPPVTPPFDTTMTPSPCSPDNVFSAQLKGAEVGPRQRLLSLFRGTGLGTTSAPAPLPKSPRHVYCSSPQAGGKAQKERRHRKAYVGVAVEKHTVQKSSPGITSSAPPVFQLRSTPPLCISKTSKELTNSPPRSSSGSGNSRVLARPSLAKLDVRPQQQQQQHGLCAPLLAPLSPVSPLLAALSAHTHATSSLLSLPAPPVPEKDVRQACLSSASSEESHDYIAGYTQALRFPHQRSLSRSARPAPIVVMPYEPREPFPVIMSASTLCSSRLSAHCEHGMFSPSPPPAESEKEQEQTQPQAQAQRQAPAEKEKESNGSTTPDEAPSDASWLDTSLTETSHSPEKTEGGVRSDNTATATQVSSFAASPSGVASPTRPISRRELIVREAARRVQNNARLHALYKLQGGSRQVDAPFLTVPFRSRSHTVPNATVTGSGLGSEAASVDSTCASSFLTLADSASPFHSTDQRYISLTSNSPDASPTAASWILAHGLLSPKDSYPGGSGSSSDGLLSPTFTLSPSSSSAPTAASWLLSQAATSKQSQSSDGQGLASPYSARTTEEAPPLTPCLLRHQSYVVALDQKQVHALREVATLEQAQRARSLAIMQCVDQKTPGRKVASMGAAP